MYEEATHTHTHTHTHTLQTAVGPEVHTLGEMDSRKKPTQILEEGSGILRKFQGPRYTQNGVEGMLLPQVGMASWS
jgi:hypothetical protein